MASLIMGMSTRLLTKPGKSFTSTGVLPRLLARSMTPSQDASLGGEARG